MIGAGLFRSFAPIWAALAAATGASQVGYDGITVQDVADVARPMASYTPLRAYTGRATAVRITAQGVSGYFVRDDADVATADNGGTVIVDASGRRWKRIIDSAPNVRWWGAKADGSDTSAAIQSAIDYMAAQGGGVLFLPAGTYTCNLVLKQGVLLTGGGGQYGYLPGGSNGVTLKQAAAGFVVDTPAGAINTCGVLGINFKGLGAGTAGGGVRFQNVNWGSVRGCQFDNFADQAVLKNAGNANVIEDVLTTNCLLNRVRADFNGCVELAGGADDYLHRIEANPSLGTISDANMRVCGVVVKAANVFAQSCVGEFSDNGWYVNGVSCRFVNCRADLNWGHGFNCNGASQYSNCLALNNSQAASNTYDGFYVNGQGDTFSNCRAKCTGAIVHKFGFEDTANYAAVTSRNMYYGCTSLAHGTGAFSMVGFTGSSPLESGTPFRDGTTTPDTTGTTFVVGTAAAATTITNFLGGYSGKTIRFLPNANYTVQSNATIATNTGADKVLAANKTYRFTHYNGKWYEDA